MILKSVCHKVQGYSLFKHHVEHPLRRVGLEQLNNVLMFQHMTDGGLALQVCGEERRGRTLLTERMKMNGKRSESIRGKEGYECGYCWFKEEKEVKDSY